jgi:uncharacterized protein (DUF427 family)
MRTTGRCGPAIAMRLVIPLPESQKIAGLISFYPEKVDVYVDGVVQQA